MLLTHVLFLIILNTATCFEGQQYWLKNGQDDLQDTLKHKLLNHKAKNVIIFIGDGMGPSTVTASRIYGKGEQGHFAFEKFHNIALLKTYSANKLVPDSCSTATALFCGVKANQKTSGVDATVPYNDCEASLVKSARLSSIIEWAQDAGKSTGFVTTTRVTHATPSALYAHTPNRKWECENLMPVDSKCKDIARQLVEDLPGKNINVIMGGGRQCLQSHVPDSTDDPVDTWSCYSKDNRNLIKDWETDKSSRNLKYKVLENTGDLSSMDPSKVDYVLGIFANGHLKMEHARRKDDLGMPSLTNMTEKAIQVLSKNNKGYVLVVEGGLIDFGHHRGHAKQALDETVSMNEAVEMALKLTKEAETLIVVTADHAHSLVFTGYPYRGTSVLGIAQQSEIDAIPYTSLLYGTGGSNNYQILNINGTVQRQDPSLNDTESFEYSQQAAVETDEVAHSGTDVVIYAKGPMAHLFSSVHEQTYVAYAIAYAANIGPINNKQPSNHSSSPLTLIACIVLTSLIKHIV